MTQKKRWTYYIGAHAILFLLALLFPLYRSVAIQITRRIPGCMIHDFCFLYCPLCGGTRAVAALLRFDLFEAFRFNAFVVLAVVFALAMDVVILVRLLKKKDRLWILPDWSWIVAVVLLVVYAVLRNYLMIAHGVDPAGDLGWIWNQ